MEAFGLSDPGLARSTNEDAFLVAPDVGLFAAADGDRRTLVQLEAAHGARCSNKKDPCCFREDAAMAAAIAKLKARVDN